MRLGDVGQPDGGLLAQHDVYELSIFPYGANILRHAHEFPVAGKISRLPDRVIPKVGVAERPVNGCDASKRPIAEIAEAR